MLQKIRCFNKSSVKEQYFRNILKQTRVGFSPITTKYMPGVPYESIDKKDISFDLSQNIINISFSNFDQDFTKTL